MVSQIIGALMLALPLAAVFVCIVKIGGWRAAGTVFVTTVALLLWCLVAARLLTGRW